MPETSTVALTALGCKINQAEIDALAADFRAAGYAIVPEDTPADVYVLNTCTVTHVADKKSRQVLRQLGRANPSALVVATGCYAELDPAAVGALPGVDLVVSNADKENLVALVAERRREQCGAAPALPRETHTGFGPAGRTRAMVKVQDGCNNFCTYCVVPYTRGPERTRPLDDVVEEVKRREAAGFQEVVLAGIHLGGYGRAGRPARGERRLRDLLERVLAETRIPRIRLSSIEPWEFGTDLLDLWQDRRLCRHLHLPLQSGSDAILRRMARRYRAGEYLDLLAAIRARIPDVAITTDVIVGFPGEGEAEFAESLETCRRAAFAGMHVFRYSPRQGTAAARFPDQVDARAKKERSHALLALAADQARAFHRRFLDRTIEVLWEAQADGVWTGLTDNYLRVFRRSSENLANTVSPARAVAEHPEGLWAEAATL